MPLAVIETIDTLTEMIRLETSPVFEMVLSLHNLLDISRHRTWAEKTRAALPQDFLDELEAVYGPYMKGRIFFELPVDAPDPNDVTGFIQHVRTMDPVRFIFYLIGRVISPDEIAAIGLDAQMLISAAPEEYCFPLTETPMAQILADPSAFQNRLANLWQRYWDVFFREEVEETLRPQWETAIVRKERQLARDGGEVLYEHITGWKELPPELPDGHPFTEMVIIPLMLLPPQNYLLYGYGNITILFDCRRTESRAEHEERAREEAARTFKGLSDDTRLKILRLIALKEGKMHGKQIAEKLELSASAVSRHIGVLKDSNLILEEPEDNRITYRLNQKTLQSLSEKVLDYLYS